MESDGESRQAPLERQRSALEAPPYVPEPIPTSNIVIPLKMIELTEKLARNAHDHWAKGRFAEGWVYGEARDDTLKTNPCLVAYEDLPEAEKEYDRRTAMETLRAIVALGYKIESAH